MKRHAVELRRFYCLQCGKETIPIMRKAGHLYKDNHRKKLWCPWCKQEINCIEINSYDDLMNFKEQFENGEFVDEANNSINYIKEEIN